jgi:large subunit ribosomal protein L21
MHAVIRAGGKQYRVAEGDVIDVERIRASSDTIEFSPLLVVDDAGRTRLKGAGLGSASVIARVVGDARGPKIDVFQYRPKTRHRRRIGHRQRYTTIRIATIQLEEAEADGT